MGVAMILSLFDRSPTAAIPSLDEKDPPRVVGGYVIVLSLSSFVVLSRYGFAGVHIPAVKEPEYGPDEWELTHLRGHMKAIVAIIIAMSKKHVLFALPLVPDRIVAAPSGV